MTVKNDDLDTELHKAAMEVAENLYTNLKSMTKEQLLKTVLKPKYAKLMKDFTKEQILECILK